MSNETKIDAPFFAVEIAKYGNPNEINIYPALCLDTIFFMLYHGGSKWSFEREVFTKKTPSHYFTQSPPQEVIDEYYEKLKQLKTK